MSTKESQAPVFGLDVPSLISIEYPLKVSHVDKALALVGGKEKLSKCFIEPDMKLELKLRPNDPYSHPLRSSVLKSNENTLFKFKIPKRIMKLNNGNIQKALNYCDSNGIKYHVEPIGMLRQNYKFRQLADFQMLTNSNSFLNDFSDSIRMGDLNKIKDFSSKLDDKLKNFQTFDNSHMDVPPLPRYARTDINHGYKYFGNLLLNDQGEWLNKSVKLHTIQIKWGDKVPIEHDQKLNDDLARAKSEVDLMKQNNVPDKILHESPSFHLIQCLEILNKLFEMKPIWIRKHIYLMLPANLRAQLRFALPFVSYTCSKGPWRHSFIKLGYDPSLDPNAAKYQIEAFRSSGTKIDDSLIINEGNSIIPPTLYDSRVEFDNGDGILKKNGVSKLSKSLLFDGENLCNCLSYQLGDILDEDIKSVLENAKLEDICHMGSGWFHWITISRIKTIIKYKLTCIRDNIPINREKVNELILKTTFQKSITQGVVSDPEQGTEIKEEDDDDEEEEEEEEEGEEEEEEEEEEGSNQIADENDIIMRLEKFNPNGSNIIQDLDSILKQENLMKW